MEDAFLNPKYYFAEAEHYKRLNLLMFFSKYANENNRENFIKNIPT